MIELNNGELIGIVSKFKCNNFIPVLKEFDTSNIKTSILYISLDRAKDEIQRDLDELNSFDKIILDNVNSNVDCIKNTILENLNESGLIIIFYFSLISLDNEDNFSIIKKYSKISRELKLLSIDIKRPIIVLFYAPNEVDLHNDAYPNLQDMRIFGAAVSDVDLVISQFYSEGKIKSKVIKNRYGDIDIIY